MKYTLCIKLNIDGNIIEQELATLSLEALEKYVSYCDSFSSSLMVYNRRDFIYFLGKTHPKIATYLDKYKDSNQPLFFKKGNVYIDIPVLYQNDIDVLLITEKELNQVLGDFNLREALSFEDKIKLGLELKKITSQDERKQLFNLSELVEITEKGKTKKLTKREKRLEQLNKRLDLNNENYYNVLNQIEFNLKSLVEKEEYKNNKQKSEGIKPNYVITGNRYTIDDELASYKVLRDNARDPEEKKILSMLVDTTKNVIEYRKCFDKLIKLKNSLDTISDESLDNEITKLQIVLAENEKRMNDLANGNVYFGDGKLEIDDPDYDCNYNIDNKTI